jgi:hypothetical protein
VFIAVLTASSSPRTSTAKKSSWSRLEQIPLGSRYLEKGFVLSEVVGCVLYKGKTILLVYVNEAMLCVSSLEVIDDIITSLKDAFDVADKGEIDDYFGVNVTWPTKDTIKV